MRNFHDLDIWRKAHQLALEVYRATDSLPKSEVFGISVQLRRTAVAIPTRIAEGSGRDENQEFATCLHKARAAASELEYLLLLCRDLGYLPEQHHAHLSEETVAVRRMMSVFLRSL
ncbi:MAG: four helix bundle protein [Acidobacteriota bacterium]|nr:four helix bundle protein [Acidobacteriota bacterium]